MEKVEGTMYMGPCPDCGETLYIFLTPQGEAIPMTIHGDPVQLKHKATSDD